jgi:hypothetical protein
LASQGLNGSLGKPCDERELEDCLVRWCPAYRSVAARRGAPVGGDPGQAGRWGTGAPV